TPGETITYAVVVSNAAGASVAHDVIVVDTLPAAFSPVNGGVPVIDGGTVGPDNGIWDLAARTITWTLASVAPGASTTLDYDIRVADPVPSPTTFTNTAVATATSLAGTVTGERTGPSAVNPIRYSATSAVTLEGPRPTLVKSVTPGSATIGEVVTFTVVASIPPSVTTYDVTVFDTLPAGLTFLDTVSATCTAPVGCAIVPVPLPAAGQRVGWFLGDLAADPLQRDITIVYRATVADVPAATAGAVLTNSAAIGSNLADEISGTPAAIPPAGDFDGTSTPATADVTVLEPRVVLTKTVAQGASQVDSRRVLPGETVTFSVTVANTGTSPAYDVVVDDVTDPRFTAVSVVAGTGWTVVDGVPTDGTLRFSVPVIPVAGSVTITYQLRVPMLTAADEVPGAELTNTADATYTSLPGVVPGERSYDDVAPDTVTLEADVASLGDTVWFDLDGNGLQGPGEPGVPGVQVTVVFAGADGVFGTADDETHPVTTAADGTYLVPNLPQGQYQVTVNPATLPAGTAVTYDQDGATGGLGTATVSLAGGEDRTDVDFGIQGTGTVGDLVWLDLNGNGTQDAGEPGLAGIGVDVTWHGPDGILGTADDITFSTVTDGTGAWTVVGVPAGDLTVALDPTTFPAGLAPVSDPDGGTADGSAADSLGAGATDLTYDFGLSGTGLIGDRLWVDLDSNGLQDLGEPGIPGATVEVRWYGLDGVVGTADDAVVTVTTGDDGLYGVGSLPPGKYDVTVTVLPAALAPTFDEDFGTVGPNGATTLTLGDGEQHRSADFGFVSTTGVGDLVWLDLNGNGSQDAGEPGLPGVEITVTSASLDGALGTSDDIVVTTTTGPDGAWLVTGLPAGLTQVEVTGTLPDGVVPSYDFDGTGTPGVSEVSLLDNTTDRTQDFGYVGANSIGDRAWVDLNLDGVQDAVEPGLGGLTVEVTWLGADGVLGGGDDLVIQTVTAGDGGYLVPGLPDGDYTVAVVAGVPAGYAPSWDEIGAADGASVVTGLGSDGPEDHSTADFGYGGTGALGGTVWLDRNADGVLGTPAEAGLPGIGIDVTWAGPDGVLGTPDDVVIHVVTGPNGVWLVEGMPPGPFIAAVDLTTLPPGTSVVFDRESGLVSPDGTLTGSLAAGERRLDVDTGVRGTAAIGDLVWVDVNRNDTLDPGEPGAADVRVVVTWHGPDGVLGGGDDVTVEVRTNPSGVYLVDGLPGGEYTVAFDGTTLPAGTVAYSDLDGGDPLVTTVTLAIGQVRGDVDLVLRIRSILAATGAAVGLLALLSLLLVGSGALLRRRAARAAR
ncbi:MAG TPA: SdrD B-like domain-containing protein, partial [Pengzhenrongella sp.]